MSDAWNLSPVVEGLAPHQRIALMLWCLDGAFKILDSVQLEGSEGLRVLAIRRAAEDLWQGPGDAWASSKLDGLRDACEAYDAELLAVRQLDRASLERIFGDSSLLNTDVITNAITDCVSIAWSLAKVIPVGELDKTVDGLAAYYDMFCQPTWNRLTVDKMTISPDEMRAVSRQLLETEPLKSVHERFNAQAAFLQQIRVVDFSDPRLRGR
jgi:hypothetical protein